MLLWFPALPQWNRCFYWPVRLAQACNICKDSDQCISLFETCRVTRPFAWQCKGELCLTVGVIWLMLQMDFIPAVMVDILKSVPPVKPPGSWTVYQSLRSKRTLWAPRQHWLMWLWATSVGNQFRTSLPCGWGNVGQLGLQLCACPVFNTGCASRGNGTKEQKFHSDLLNSASSKKVSGSWLSQEFCSRCLQSSEGSCALLNTPLS